LNELSIGHTKFIKEILNNEKLCTYLAVKLEWYPRTYLNDRLNKIIYDAGYTDSMAGYLNDLRRVVGVIKKDNKLRQTLGMNKNKTT